MPTLASRAARIASLASLCLIAVAPAYSHPPEHPAPSGVSPHAAMPAVAKHEFLSLADVKWQHIVPEMGEGSPRIAFLHTDPATGAAHLLIWTPRNFHVPRHWHSANETHLILEGTMAFQADGGERVSQKHGDFNFMPKKMIHQAWTTANEDALIYITVDGPWDINWVDGPPTAPK